jgi:hypothetical protein
MQQSQQVPMMKTLLISLGLVATVAHADCLMRTSVRLTPAMITGVPTDFQKLVVPDPKGSRCMVRYRVSVKGDWQTVEGTGTGTTEDQACTRAMDLTQGAVLDDVRPGRVSADSQMICSDLPDIRVHPVRIGDVIWESETDLHSHPQEQKYFTYKRTQCRMFVERNAQFQNLYTYQGIICRQNATQYSKWQVVDKY